MLSHFHVSEIIKNFPFHFITQNIVYYTIGEKRFFAVDISINSPQNNQNCVFPRILIIFRIPEKTIVSVKSEIFEMFSSRMIYFPGLDSTPGIINLRGFSWDRLALMTTSWRTTLCRQSMRLVVTTSRGRKYKEVARKLREVDLLHFFPLIFVLKIYFIGSVLNYCRLSLCWEY